MNFKVFVSLLILWAVISSVFSGIATNTLMSFLQEHTSLRANGIMLLGTVSFIVGFLSLIYVPIKIRMLRSMRYPNDEFLETLFLPMGYLSSKTVSYKSNSDSYLNFIIGSVLRLNRVKRDTAMKFFLQGRNSTAEQTRAVLNKYHAYWTTDFEKKRLFLWQIGIIYYFGYYFVDPRYTYAMSNIAVFKKENELFDTLARWYGIDDDEVTVLFELVCRIYGYGGYYRDINSDQDTYQSYFGRHDNEDWSDFSFDGYSRINKPTRQEIRKACKFFKINSDTNYAEAKKIYRNMMLKNHPDRVAGAGLSDEQIRKQTVKSQEIQEAWNVIRFMYRQKEEGVNKI